MDYIPRKYYLKDFFEFGSLTGDTSEDYWTGWITEVNADGTIILRASIGCIKHLILLKKGSKPSTKQLVQLKKGFESWHQARDNWCLGSFETAQAGETALRMYREVCAYEEQLKAFLL